MNGVVTLRRLTPRSRVGFGKFPNSTVQAVIDAGYANWLRQVYYTVASIDFTDEVKAAADIRITIDKPGVSAEAWEACRRQLYAEKKETMSDIDLMKEAAHWKKERTHTIRARRLSRWLGECVSKGKMQAVNHGRAHWEDKR